MGNRQVTSGASEKRFEKVVDALFVGPAIEVVAMSSLNCSAAEKLMSPFIDSMVTPQEAERLRGHVAFCDPCRRHLQSFIPMRSLMARIETPSIPEDMVLETRVRLSQARNKNLLVRLENRLNYLLKPMVVPVVLGVSLTMLFFGVLSGALRQLRPSLRRTALLKSLSWVSSSPFTPPTLTGFDSQKTTRKVSTSP